MAITLPEPLENLNWEVNIQRAVLECSHHAPGREYIWDNVFVKVFISHSLLELYGKGVSGPKGQNYK